MTKEIIITTTNRPGTYIYSVMAPFNAYSFGYGSTSKHLEMSALNAAFSTIQYKPLLNFINGKNSYNRKLPITVQTCSEEFIEIANRLTAANPDALDAASFLPMLSPQVGYFARKLKDYSITWRLLAADDPIITELQSWVR